MFMFGSGVMTVTPNGVANPTPVNIGLLQEGTISFKSQTKKLYGQYRDPLAVGAGTRDWTGKAKVARLSGRVLNALVFGGTLSTGFTNTAYESDSVPASTPYTVTTTNSATWTTDLGVVYAATGLPLTRVASAPTAGQYSVAAGVYTFSSGDASKAVVIAYNYTVTATGESIVIPPSLLGSSLNFALNFTAVDPTTNLTFTGIFNNCVCENFNLQTKLEDFVMPELDFSLFTNAAGSIGSFNFPDSI